MTATVIEMHCEADDSTPRLARENSVPRTGVRNFSTFASFVGNQFLQSMKRRHISLRKSTVDITDFQQIEEDEELIEVATFPFHRFHSAQSDEPTSLKSPRRVLQKQIPNGASQQLRMDLILLSECPRRDVLKECAWKGCSAENRAQVWRMLIGYEPLNHAERKEILASKREEYRQYLHLLHAPKGPIDISPSGTVASFTTSASFSSTSGSGRAGDDTDNSEGRLSGFAYSSFSAKTLRQIEMDLPRTHPDVPIFHVDEVRNAMRRILYVFGILNPNNNYVQGMNEILTPILVVFLSDYIKERNEKGIDSFLKRKCLRGVMDDEELADAEADAFWTFKHIVSLIEDNFVTDQPGVLRRVARLEEIVEKVDPVLKAHLAKNGNEFIQFSYRWMNCLLMRELPFGLVVRVWDAFLADDDGMADLHVYFCAAMLTCFSVDLLKMDFEDCILFLQHLPTVGWDVKEIDELLSQAHVWKRSLHLTVLASDCDGGFV